MGSGRTEYGFGVVAVAFLMGSLIGVGLGLIFASRTGQETRDRIKERAEEARGRMRETARTVRGRAEELSQTVQEKFAEARVEILGFTDRMLEKISPAGEKDEA